MAADLPRLLIGLDLAQGEVYPFGAGLAAVVTAKSLENDQVNEDACALLPFGEEGGALVVADGAGGLPAGDKAAALTIKALGTRLKAAQARGEDLRSAVLDGIEQASRDVHGLGVGAGSTVAIAAVTGNMFRSYHVGDSQIMVVGQRGKLKLFTKSHSPVGYAVEAGLLAEKEAMLHEERHLVSNLVGQTTMHIEMGPPLELAPHDTVIVASDGLFDNLHTHEIIEICRSGELLGVVEELAAKARARMVEARDGMPSKPDDLTVIAFRQR